MNRKFLIAIDGSLDSTIAFYCGLEFMNKKTDELNFLTVIEDESNLYSGIATGLFSAPIVLEATNFAKTEAKSRLKAFCHKAKELGFENVSGSIGTSSHVGEMIVQVVVSKKIDFVILGRRGMGVLKRLLVGSNSKYVVENCPCNVIVVKADSQKEEKIKTFHEEIQKLFEEEKKKAEEIGPNHHLDIVEFSSPKSEQKEEKTEQ